MEADLGAIAASGLETVTPVVVLNTADYRDVVCASGTVKPGDPLVTIKV
jgi:phosphotransferase system IIA component